mmetsp:Transcript_14085/g.37821  ORF Transcript_14085/g.37821 Transcript_14085/m.37821 type:complete len:965 (+) Transcript_14085:60-2954(+)|eukprot:CAMPEP_0185836758 /NCGR_PEP_ID=MMETSP1353-20130828/10259_1 /TAXON_ID=1077150 /ORGANISM="Erythrolobus australicus, Strain CCMP3124" /LENGTH=964 /DNA_ID=CAMNT_0028535585 /DNA_START=45 /DNA_END=2939 /DNA_ORIENTATION=-
MADGAAATAPHLSEFRDIVAGPVSEYAVASEQLGGCVKDQAALVKAAFEELYKFLVSAAQQQKPSDDALQTMVAPIGELMGKVQTVASDTPPREPLFNHVSAWSESIAALGWVMVDSKAVAYISDFEGAGEFYTSKVLMTYKKADNAAEHQTWVKAVKQIFADLKAYVKSHHTQKLEWNKGLTGGTAGAEDDDGDDDDDEGDEDGAGEDPVSAFDGLISGPVDAYLAASKAIGGEVEKQALVFVEGWKKEAEFLRQAAKMPKPADVQGMVGDIAAEMGKVGEIAGDMPPRETLYNHVTAIGESVGVLGWVVLDSKPVAYIGDMEGAGEFYLSKVLMTYKKADDGEKHLTWVKTVKDMYAALKAYVKEHFTVSLTWNFGGNKPAGIKKKKKKAVADDDDDDAGGSDPVSAFQAILDEQLAAYSASSKKIGGEVEKQAEAFALAWKQELEFMKKASKMAKPDDVQAMVGDIAGEMGKVSEFATSVPPRDAHFNHVTAIGESVGVLGWVVLDSKPVPYISDMEGAGEFYLSKVLMAYKKADDAAVHQEWVKNVKDLYAALKAYVKEYFTTGLTWNFEANRPKKTGGKKSSGGKKKALSGGGNTSLAGFKAFLDGPVAEFSALSANIGGPVLEQSKSLVAAFEKEYEFLQKAAGMPKPGSQDDVMTMLTPIGTEIGKVQEIQNSVAPRDPFVNHLTAIGETIPALSWVVVESKPVAFVGDMEGAGDFYFNKVLVDYKKADDASTHQAWVKAARTIFGELKKFVKEHHTTGLMWNTGASGGVAAGANDDEDDDASPGGNPISDFEELMKGSVASYADLSKKIGDVVQKQAEAFIAVFEKELVFLKDAAGMPKPSDDVFQTMVTPVGMAMGAVNDVKDAAPPNSEFMNHLTAIAESVPALGWVAVDSKPVAYVGDMAGAGEFYLNKVLTQFKGKDSAPLHREWVAAVKQVYDDLKKYIKQWHTLKLSWKQ